MDWPYHKIGIPGFGRAGLQHKIINYEPLTGEIAHDDEISLNTQSGSQWDGFMHYGDKNLRCYYNGLQHTDEVGRSPDSHGIHRELSVLLMTDHADFSMTGANRESLVVESC